MSQLPRQHAQLPTMVSLVRHEVAEKMDDIRGKVLPGRWRKHAAPSKTESDQSIDSLAAPRERPQQLLGLNRTTVDTPRDHNAMPRTKHLDPHASGVVYVRSDHPHRAARIAGRIFRPDLDWQILDEIRRHTLISAPRAKQQLAVYGIGWAVFRFAHGFADGELSNLSDRPS